MMKNLIALLTFVAPTALAASPDFATPPMPGEFMGRAGPVHVPYFVTSPLPPAFNSIPGPVRIPIPTITPATVGTVQPLIQIEPGVFIDSSLLKRKK